MLGCGYNTGYAKLARRASVAEISRPVRAGSGFFIGLRREFVNGGRPRQVIRRVAFSVHGAVFYKGMRYSG